MRFNISEIVDVLLKISLLIALLCSTYIFVNAFALKRVEYKSRFLAWQLPMIIALLFEIYLIEN